jgi:hypothetical protein
MRMLEHFFHAPLGLSQPKAPRESRPRQSGENIVQRLHPPSSLRAAEGRCRISSLSAWRNAEVLETELDGVRRAFVRAGDRFDALARFVASFDLLLFGPPRECLRIGLTRLCDDCLTVVLPTTAHGARPLAPQRRRRIAGLYRMSQ